MLEACRSLLECEKILSKEMEQIRFIGQVVLSKQDLKILQDFINHSIASMGIHQTKINLKYKFPFCTAFFMVYKGIWEYRSGNYWSYLSPLPDISGPANQSEWGEWFLKFLGSHSLTEFEEMERTYKYVTPILIHGGIPQTCIGSFFEKVVVPLIERGYKDREEIIDFLYSYRIRQKEILKTEEQINKIQGQLSRLEAEKIYVTGLMQCLNRLNLFFKIGNENDTENRLSLRKFRDFYVEKQRELEILKNSIENLRIKHHYLEETLSHLIEIKNKYEESINIVFQIKSCLSFVEKTKKQVKRSGIQRSNWCLKASASTFLLYHENRKRLRKLYFSRILKQYNEDFENLKFLLKNLIEQIVSICASVSEKYDYGLIYRDAADEVAVSLEALDAANIDTIDGEELQTILHLLENISMHQNEVYNKLEKAKKQLSIDISEKSEQFKALDHDIKQIENFCRYLGDGYLEDGFRKIPQWISNQGKIRTEKSLEIALLKQDLQKCEDNIKSLSCFVQYAERSIQYFLTYGDDWAEEWLVAGVSMALGALEKESSKDFKIYRPSIPARFIDAFYEWWHKQINTDTEKSLRNSAMQTGQHFTTPILALDPIFGELKIIVGTQRISVSEYAAQSNLFVRIDDKSQSSEPAIIPLRCYRVRGEDLIETREIEYELEGIATNYTVTLASGDETYKSWEIEGIDENVPYMIFNKKGIHISGESCPKREAWILMRDEYEFKDDNIAILEEAFPPALPEGFRLVLVDLSNTGSFTIGKKYESDDEFLSVKVGEEVPEPYIIDASYVPGLSVSGVPVCNDNLPKFAVPLNLEYGLDGWSMVIRKGKELRKYIRLSELKDIDEYLGNEYAVIDFSQLVSSMKDPIGFYSIYLRSPKGNEINFEFVYMPDLLLDFDTNIHLPSDNFDNARILLIFPRGLSFAAELPAIVTDVVDEAYDVEVPWEADELLGEVFIDGKESLSFRLQLPNIKWRVQGLDQEQSSGWNIMSKEIWADGWENTDKAFLYICIPPLLEDRAYYYEVGIYGSDHWTSGKFVNNKASVNLLEFSDTIAANLETYDFYIRIYDSRYKSLGEGFLFSLRNHWEVRNLQWHSKLEGGNIELNISWEDLGKVKDRIIQLWKCWKPWEAPVKYFIPDGENSICIQENISTLRDGNYLLRFEVEGPWDQPASSDFPREDGQIHFIEVSSSIPQVGRWELLYNSYGDMEIRGRVLGVSTGTGIECVLIGLYKGKPLAWKGKTISMDNGNFSLTIPYGNIVRQWAHWLLIKGVDAPFYQVSVIPEASILELEIDDCLSINNIEPSMFSYMRIISDDREQKSYKFGENIARKILGMSSRDKGEMELKSSGEEKKQKLKVIYESGQYYLMLENGVKCTSCGAVVESQSIWHLEHYPRCKSFIYRYTGKMNVNIIVGIDSRPAIKCMQDKYKLAGSDLLELYSNIHNPKPERIGNIDQWIDNPAELKYETVNLLREELKLLKMSLRGGEANER